MISHFPNLLFVIVDTLFVATIRVFVTARVTMISLSTSSRTLYICTLNPVSNLKFLSKVIAAIYAYEGLFV